MGYAATLRAAQQATENAALQAAAAAEAVSLTGLVIVVDVQHVFRGPPHAGDRGSLYTLANGTHVWEAAAAAAYAMALSAFMRARGAVVLTNDPIKGLFVGPYSRRNRDSVNANAHAYLACHVNAGGGSYCAAEYLLGTPGASLGAPIGRAVTAAFRNVTSYKCVPLQVGQRGAVCVEACAAHTPAVVVEPCFGDNPAHQAIIAESYYTTALGIAIGRGVQSWWRERVGGGALPAG